MLETHKRSFAKAVSWRATGTLDTFLISWLITGEPLLAGGIAATEVATKIVLFYLHERAWARVSWGQRDSLPHAADAPPPVAVAAAAERR